MKSIAKIEMARAVKTALAEDLGTGDITTEGIVKTGEKLRAAILAQARGTIAGIPLVREVYFQLDRGIKIRSFKQDGQTVVPGDRILEIQGPAGPMLTGERTALNFLGMLSGIATQTARFVRAVEGTGTQVLDTRKTPPGLRALVKYAVAAGGGFNHRMGLYDAVLIKDNHIALAHGSISEAIDRLRSSLRRRMVIEVETENLEQVKDALVAGVDVILLDNLIDRQLRVAVEWIKGRAKSEVSGGLDLKSARRAARLGVDRISVGALTHSAPWLPLHMEVE